VVQAAVGFLLGAGALAAGFYLKYNWLAAVGFAVMIMASVWAVASYRRMAGMTMDRRKRRDRRAAKAAAANGGLMDRIEERWRRRQEGNNR
jgi:heme exporter protein D